MADHAVVGDFLVRESESNVGEFSLSLEGEKGPLHFRIKTKNGKCFIGRQKFESLEILVRHYMETSLSRRRKLFLI
jgi:hypothetical protein